MKNELQINGFSHITENELLDVNGGELTLGFGMLIVIGIVTIITLISSNN